MPVIKDKALDDYLTQQMPPASLPTPTEPTTREQNPFTPAPIEDKGSASYMSNKLDQSKREFTSDTDTAKTDSDAEFQRVKDTPRESLYKYANSNMARGEGPYGMFNNRTYNHTLRLAREADAYNNAPQDKKLFFQSGGSGQMGNLSLVDKYSKPEIQTMETRAMDQAIKLDTNQKQLAQALQDAVNHKDLDAFIALYKQRYGIVLDRENAALEMIKLARQSQMSDVMQKYASIWRDKWQRYINADTLGAIQDLLAENPLFSNYIGNFLVGASPTLDDVQGQEAIRQLLKKKFPTWDGRYYGSNVPNILEEYTKTMQELQIMQSQMNSDFSKKVKKLKG